MPLHMYLFNKYIHIDLYICMQACEASQQADYESTDDIAYPLETEMLAMARAVEEGEVSTV